MGSLSQNSNIANSTVITFNPQTGLTYSPSAGDSNKVITLSNAAGCTVTMPNPAVVGAGFHFWLEARNNAANLVTQFAAEKFFINGAAVAGVNNFNLSPVGLQTSVGWDQVVHIACDGTNWHVIQGDPLLATNLSGLSAATFASIDVSGAGGANLLTLTNTNNYAYAKLVGTGFGGEIDFYNGATALVSIVGTPVSSGTLDIYAGLNAATKVLTVVGTGISVQGNGSFNGTLSCTTTFSAGGGGLTVTSTGYLTSVGSYNTTTPNPANVQIDGNGSFNRVTSALKYKHEIRDLELIDVNRFRPVRYKPIDLRFDQTKDYFGIVADEVEAAGIPELVTYGNDGEIESFAYERLTVVLLKAVQDLTARLAALETK